MAAVEPMNRQQGRVKWFDVQKGWGFIEPADGSDDVFVHQQSIQAQGFRSLDDGEDVEFETETDVTGRKRAVNVSGPNGAPVRGSSRSSAGRMGGGGGSRGYNGSGGGPSYNRQYNGGGGGQYGGGRGGNGRYEGGSSSRGYDQGGYDDRRGGSSYNNSYGNGAGYHNNGGNGGGAYRNEGGFSGGYQPRGGY